MDQAAKQQQQQQQQQMWQQMLLLQLMQNPTLLKQAQDMAAAQTSEVASTPAPDEAASVSGGAVPYQKQPVAQLTPKQEPEWTGSAKSPAFIPPPTWVAKPGPGLTKKYSCKFFAEGRCTKGEACAFNHEGPGAMALQSWSPEMQEKAICSVHGFSRTFMNLMDDGTGGYVCTSGNECRGFKRVKRPREPDWYCTICSDGPFFTRDLACRWCGSAKPTWDPDKMEHVGATTPTLSHFETGPGYTKKYPCKFFAEGTCHKGDLCAFSHEPEVFDGAEYGTDGGAEPPRKKTPVLVPPPPRTPVFDAISDGGEWATMAQPLKNGEVKYDF